MISVICPCGKTKIQADMPPIGAGFCHCKDCRTLIQGAAFEGVLWPPSGHLKTVQGKIVQKPRPDMKMISFNCSECGIMVSHTENSGLEIISSTELRRCNDGKLPEGCKPVAHHWYSQRIFDVNDDLVKWFDGPTEFGKSGKKCNIDGSVLAE